MNDSQSPIAVEPQPMTWKQALATGIVLAIAVAIVGGTVGVAVLALLDVIA